LQSMLGLKNHDEALIAALAVGSSLYICEKVIKGRRKVPDTTKARQRVERIHATARQLRMLLSEEPAALDLIGPPGDFLSHLDTHEESLKIAAARAPDKLAAMEAKRRRLVELLSLLEELEANALEHATDDDVFRAARWLVPGVPTDADVSEIASRELWPILFELWELAGKKPAATENGPTYRFIAFVHRAAGLPEPKAGTVADAVDRWREGNRPRMLDGVPPWRADGLDRLRELARQPPWWMKNED
jgi:hypothetical protein